MTVMNVLRFLTAIVLFASPIACVLEDAPPRHLSTEPSLGGGHGGGVLPPPAGSSSGATSSGGPTEPMLVVVDTGQTLTAVPGDGVGVFIEYASGGRWTIWWTCDTNITGQNCSMLASASVASGSITAATPTGLENGTLDTTNPSRVRATASVSTTLQGMTFNTAPGAILTVEASVGGLKDAAFLFFVQDGKVNGGVQSKLTNPLQLQGKTP